MRQHHQQKIKLCLVIAIKSIVVIDCGHLKQNNLVFANSPDQENGLEETGRCMTRWERFGCI